MMAKRMRAAWLALCFCLITIFPVKPSQAVIPLVGMAVAAIGPGGTVVAADLLSSGVAALIGGTIIAIGLNPSTADAPMRVPLISDKPTIDAAIPPPAAPVSTAPTQSPGVTCRVGSFTRSGASYDEACAAAFGASNDYSNQQAGGGACPRVGYNTCETYGGYSAGNITVNWTLYCVSQTCVNGIEYGGVVSSGSATSSVFTTTAGVIESCGAGYTMSGGTCVLANARAAVPDSRVDVERSAQGFQYPPGSDADAVPSYGAVGSANSGAAPPLGSAAAAPGKVYASGRDSSGRPVMVEYAVSADGTKTYITHYTQSEIGGQSVVNTQSVTVDASSGQVTSASGSAAQGSLSGVGTGAVPTVNTGTAVAPSAGGELVFPSDYARTGEAASAANTVKTAVDGVKDKLTNSETVADPVVPSWVDPWGNTFNGLTGWQLPGHASSCPAPSFTWEGTAYAFNTHCQLWADHSSVFTVAMSVVWAIVAVFILLGA